MFPEITDIINYLFGTDIHFFVKTYGFFLGLAYIAGIMVIRHELRLREKKGWMLPVTRKVLTGNPAKIWELVVLGILGFLFAYKFTGILADYETFSKAPRDYLLSLKGNYVGGILFAALLILIRWYEKYRKKLDQPEWREIKVYPHQHTGSILLIAVLAGLSGAKLFHCLEYFNLFLSDPLGQLFSFSGLTFYGGLITGTLAVVYYCKKNRIDILQLLDSTAPAIVLGYGIGRAGCMLSGDGCWGIVNTHPKPGWLSWLPDWMWSYHFPHNVINAGVEIPGCSGTYCKVLPQPVYPTSFYDFVIMMFFFLVLLLIRNRIKIPGYLFTLTLCFIAIQRFFIEKIRVNVKYQIAGFGITQAEIISIILLLFSIAGFWFLGKLYLNKQKHKIQIPEIEQQS